MLKRSVVSLAFVLTAAAAFAIQPKTAIMPEEDVKPGMHGVAYTVFEGTQPESMDVEILGILHDMAGPKAEH